MKNIIIFLMFLFGFSSAYCNINIDSLKKEIQSYIETKDAVVGVAILDLESGETMTIGNENHFPMQSVYKFHLALAVLDQVDKGKLKLDKEYTMTKKDLRPDTWSPIREKYPNGEAKLTLAEIIEYTVSMSDNNGCDFLFKLIGGTKKVNKYIHSLGINDVSIKATEAEMSKSWEVQYTNWTTPLAAVQLLQKFYSKKILSEKSYEFLWNAMVNTYTGPNRIKGLLPEKTRVAHKTGSSWMNEKGITAAMNDIGIIKLPNGKHIAIAVFVTNSKEEDELNERIIAYISKMVWNFYVKK